MTAFIDPNTDVVRRSVPRELYCKLDDAELLRIARTRTNKEAERDQLSEDLALEVQKRKAQIKELDDEIGKMGRELRTGEQERTVKCNEVFHRAPDGVGWIVVVRLDTLAEVERRPANAHETQRYLPSLDGGGILDEAARRQRTAQDDEPSDVPGDDDEADDGASARSKPPKPEKFDAALLDQGKCALRFEGGAACEFDAGHTGLHKSANHSWKARRPKVERAEESEA